MKCQSLDRGHLMYILLYHHQGTSYGVHSPDGTSYSGFFSEGASNGEHSAKGTSYGEHSD